MFKHYRSCSSLAQNHSVFCVPQIEKQQGKMLPSTQRVQTGRDLPTSWKTLEFAGKLNLLQAFSSVRFNLFFLLLLLERCWFHSVRFLVYLSSPLKSHSLCYGAVQTHLSLSLGQPPLHTNTHTCTRHKGTPVTDSHHNISLPPPFIYGWIAQNIWAIFHPKIKMYIFLNLKG